MNLSENKQQFFLFPISESLEVLAEVRLYPVVCPDFCNNLVKLNGCSAQHCSRLSLVSSPATALTPSQLSCVSSEEGALGWFWIAESGIEFQFWVNNDRSFWGTLCNLVYYLDDDVDVL